MTTRRTGRILCMACLTLAMTCAAVRIAGFEEPKDGDKPQSTAFELPRLELMVSDDGAISRRAAKLMHQDVGGVWMSLLKEPGVIDELELLAGQREQIQTAHRKMDRAVGQSRDATQFRPLLEKILLPHQLGRINQILGRYYCLTIGVRQQLITSATFRNEPVSEPELERVMEALTVLGKKYLATSERELHALDGEVRNSLTQEQLRQLKELIGDRKVVEGPYLDFAILRLESILQSRVAVEIPAAAAVLGRITQYDLALNGRLRPSSNETPIHFWFACEQGLERAGIRLDEEGRSMFRDFKGEIFKTFSAQSMRTYEAVLSGEMTFGESQIVMKNLAEREIKRCVSALDEVLSAGQRQQLEEYARRRDLNQRGMLALLIDGERIKTTDLQKEAWKKLVREKLARYRDLARELESEIWQAVSVGLSPSHRKVWAESYGDGVFEWLPVSPILLLVSKPFQ